MNVGRLWMNSGGGERSDNAWTCWDPIFFFGRDKHKKSGSVLCVKGTGVRFSAEQ